MNGKLALALILALQVSVSLCELPTPNKELVDKYDNMTNTFNRRILNAYAKLQESLAPIVEKLRASTLAQSAKDYVVELRKDGYLQTPLDISKGLVEGATPVVEQARKAGLGVYQQYLRPEIGVHLDRIISLVQIYLDKVLPAK